MTARMKDDLLDLLKREWVTPIVALEKASCFSLSQRVGNFLRDGINVQKKWVELPNGKRVMSYHIPEKV